MNEQLDLGRWHHIAYVVKDQAATRHFYEDVVGLPLIACWAEVNEFRALPGRQVEYCHTFYALGDGSAIAFFCFADDEAYEALRPQPKNGFTHSAVNLSREAQDEMKARLEAAGYQPYVIDHGYVRSLYVNDPDDLVLEFTCDPENAAEIAAWQAETAHATLERWLSGDRTPNNDLHHR
jgi:catechol 2,3-dioxygenase-like lactoylglutathione lyase family enzyme